MFYTTLSSFDKYVHPESRIFLCKKDCACCGKDMGGYPFGMVSTCVSTKWRNQRLYFPLYYIICEGCFEIFFEESKERLPGTTPSWSLVDTFFDYKYFPTGLAMLGDEDSLDNLFYSMYQSTSTWEAFSQIRGCRSISDILEIE